MHTTSAENWKTVPPVNSIHVSVSFGNRPEHRVGLQEAVSFTVITIPALNPRFKDVFYSFFSKFDERTQLVNCLGSVRADACRQARRDGPSHIELDLAPRKRTFKIIRSFACIRPCYIIYQ